MPFDEEITPGLMASLLEEGKSQRQAFWNKIREIRTLRHKKHIIDIPKLYAKTAKVVKNSIPWKTAEFTTASLTTNFPYVNVEPAGPTDNDQRLASRKERWIDAVLQRLVREAGEDVFTLTMDAAANDGLGICKLVYSPNHWSAYTDALLAGPVEITDEEDQRAVVRKETPKEFINRTLPLKQRSKLPWAWRFIDPTSYIPFYDEDGLAIVLEWTRRQRFSLNRKFIEDEYGPQNEGGWQKWTEVIDLGRAIPPGEYRTSDTTVEMLEMWTRDIAAYYCNGYFKVIKNVQKRPPYFEIPGLMSASSLPEERYMSSLYGMNDLAQSLDALLTMHQNSAYLHAFPKLVKMRTASGEQVMGRSTLPTPGDEQQSDNTPLRWQAGDIIDLTSEPGTTIEWSVPPDSPQLMTQIQIHQGLLQDASPAAVFFGQAAGADEAGYAINQRVNQSKMPLNWIARNASTALTEMVQHIYWSLENNVREDIEVWGRDKSDRRGRDAYGFISLGPKDLDGFYSCTVELQPTLPFEEIQNGQFASLMRGAGLMSQTEAIEKRGGRHPDQVKDELLIEEFMNTPQVKQSIMVNALERAGLIPVQPVAPSATNGAAPNPSGESGLGGGGMPDEMTPMPGIGRPTSDAVAPMRGRAAGAQRMPNTPTEGT